MTKQLYDLTVGDHVLVKRNLNHPVHKRFVESDDGGDWVADENVEDVIGILIVTERRDTPAIGEPGGWRYRPARSIVRLDSGFWYDLADGYQDGARATIIEPTTK